MPTAIVTGAGGLVGSSAVNKLVERGYKVVGIDNDMRREFFGDAGSTTPMIWRLEERHGDAFRAVNLDIRSRRELEVAFTHFGDVELVIHTAAQPSHDWAATQPHVDFEVNALGTLNVLEATRALRADVTVAHISTSKVYGDRPNGLELLRSGDRLDLTPGHKYYNGITPEMSVDRCLHSLFGASKLSGDLVAQEYGRYFDMPVVVFRPGCVTGAAHAGVELHGFLAYLMRCALEDRQYKIIGYEGRQVRCNIHADDLVDACLAFHDRPGFPGAVYNIGGGRGSSCSVLEAISLVNELTGREMRTEYVPTPRVGDHKWWISDISEFRSRYPQWNPRPLLHTLGGMYEEMAR